MYKVMIVDDERLIREGLSSLIDWQEHGFQVTAVARDGFDAMAWFDKEPVQLMITDIRMPGMDGLQLVEALRRQAPGLHVLVLSGFAEFDYAKRALVSRVDGYLLKPVDEDELTAQLKRIKAELDRKREDIRDGSNEIIRRREELIQALASGSAAGDHRLASRLESLELAWSQYQVLLVDPHSVADAAGDALVLARQSLRESIDQRRIGVVFFMGRRVGVLLRQTWVKPAALDQLYREIARVLIPRKIDFHAAVGGVVDGPLAIADSCHQAESRLGGAFFAPTATIISADFLPAEPMAAGTAAWDLPQRVERLSYALDTRNDNALDKALEETVAAMRSQGLDESGIKSAFAGLAGAISERYLSYHPAREDVRDGLGDWMGGLYRQEHLDKLVAFMRARLLDLWQRDVPAGADTLVERMKDLIERHSSDNLRLETLAEAFGYNSAYLGKVFKAKTGEYFNAWLDKVRIGKAKEHLRRGLKVYQVAQIVGYADADYFQQKFKKLTGVTPSAWKDRAADDAES